MVSGIWIISCCTDDNDDNEDCSHYLEEYASVHIERL